MLVVAVVVVMEGVEVVWLVVLGSGGCCTVAR
jgi:hypothetical protein